MSNRATVQHSNKSNKIKSVMPETLTRFGIAGCAGIGATTCVHWLDVLRVNLQVDASKGGKKQYRGVIHAATHVYKQGGIRGLYAGISAGYFRQITYGMPRMAIYPILAHKIKSDHESVGQLPLWKKFACGATAGGIASMSGVPSEVSLVRMSADQKLKPSDPLRRNYTSVFNAINRIVKEEGLKTLWQGAAPTVARAILLNAGQLAVYSDAKERIKSTFGFTGVPLQFSSSLVASAVATAMCNPADVIKSRMQNMRPGEYSGVVDCVTKMTSPLSLYKGYTPAMIKLAPHTVISLAILDNLSLFLLGKAAL